MYVNDRHTDWDLYHKAVCYSYNTSASVDSTQFSPLFIMLGPEPLQPIDTILPHNKNTASINTGNCLETAGCERDCQNECRRPPEDNERVL